VIIGVPKESYPGERRVALVPAVVPNLVKAGFKVAVEAGAGIEAGYADAQYTEKGATLASSRAEVFANAEIIVQVLCYGANDLTGKADLPLLRNGQVLIGFLRPLGTAEVVEEIARTLLRLAGTSLELVSDPELTRPVDVPVVRGDPAKLKAATGWVPEIDLDQTLSDVLEQWSSLAD